MQSFCGFALQLVPCAILLQVPFQEGAFSKGRKRAFALLSAFSVLFSLIYPLHVWWWSIWKPENNNLDDNIFMLLAIAGVTALFFRVTHANPVQKCSVLFIVVSYAAVQYFLSNMLMDFLPLDKQDMVYNDATLAAYLITTVILFPLVTLFMHRKMKHYLVTLDQTVRFPMEFFFLMVVLVIYLLLNVLYSALWVSIRDMLQPEFNYFIPFSLFLSILLIFTFYCTINLSVLKFRNTEQAVEIALMRQNYNHIEESIEHQKRALHDTRQLLRNLSSLAKEGTKENLLDYINEAMEYTMVSDTTFCANPCINGLLNYYAGLAETQKVGFSAKIVCDKISFSDTDMTILLGNALDNAVRTAAEYGKLFPQSDPQIQLVADTVNDQFAIQIDNSCIAVSYAPGFQGMYRPGNEGWLPSGAFLSTHGGGYGLRRMEMIAEKYHGHAWFSFDADNHVFITRLMLTRKDG